MIKAYFIEARTGCSCCSDENHYRGPYRTRVDAERRMAHYLFPQSTYWPLASQYARQGRYSIEEVEMEPISGDRVIIHDRVFPTPEFIEVRENGTVENNEAEYFTREFLG